MKGFHVLLPIFTLNAIPVLVNAQSIKDLDFLIGKWKVEETILPGTPNEYKEIGMRTCEYYLGDAFIKCEAETTVSTTGKKRNYAYFINYNQQENYFTATGIASDFPHHGQHLWFLDAAAQKITFVTPKNVNGDRFFRGTIRAEGNSIIWEGWASKFQSDKEWTQIFRDIAVKVH